jgi:hypothetical protein
VASGGARRGRRDNGLVAAEYAAAGDVDPRVGEHLLDVLGLRGIAAYLQPAADLHPITRSTTLPARPTDRLFVDRVHLDTARDFLAQLTGPEQPPADPTAAPAAADGTEALAGGASIDDLFAAIVAGYDRDTDSHAWPEAEDLPPRQASGQHAALAGDEPEVDEPPLPGSGARPLRRWHDSTLQPDGWRSPTDDTGLLDGLDSAGADFDGDEDDDEGYTPPPPPPLPRIPPAVIAATLSIIAGVVVFFHPSLIPLDQTFAMVLGFCGILGGFVALVWRLRPGDDDDDPWDPNDGAVV